MLRVTVSYRDVTISAETDDGYSPDLIDDLARRASSTLAATVVQLLAVVED